ncbi:hypothetical protein LMG28727_05343 [Paraburkholderia kirstenboschensis]|uniref:hypothetical protein n=1 Tax=Paraburkholderia kirstenboschensis TaxID=1245436 RepID=UPI0019182732|nr:hypothetical protein [Paraburkholderia kirstenboschensis]CAD6552137.1 hypothetical protein LMG28727_05343 [Paraburkholderia kirstenboschensis]
MSVREQQVNDALRVLDEMHRLCRIERGDYRERRRRLLESLRDATERVGRDTVRRAVPQTDATAADGTAPRRDGARRSDAHGTRSRRTVVRRVAACAFALGVLACAAVLCWFTMGA